MHQCVEVIARLHGLEHLPIVLGMLLGVLDHFLDLGLGEARRRFDGDLVFLAGRLVLGIDVQDAVGVDVERDLDLRQAARRRRNPFQIELAEALVARRHVTLALQHVDGHRRLIVVGGREHLLRLSRNGRVLLDELGHHAAQRLNAQRQWRHVEQQHVLDVALQHTGLDRCANCYCFVRVDVLARLLAEEFLHLFLHLWHPRHAADQNHVADVGQLDACVLDRNPARLDGALDQILDQRLELGAGDFDRQMLRAGFIGGDIRQVDLGLL